MAKPNLSTLFVLLFLYLITTVVSNESPPSTRDNDTSPPLNTPQYFNPPFDPQNPSEPRISKSGVRLITLNELKAHGVNGTIRPLWLAILGRVFDVDRAYSTHYGPDGGYNFFTGIDGSKAFVTGEFNDEGLTDDILDLDPLLIEEIENWSRFYDKDYTYVGKLIGRYYDETGNPTKYWYKYQKKLREADAIKIEKRAQEQKFPPCNSRFTPEDGGTVYCSKKRSVIKVCLHSRCA